MIADNVGDNVGDCAGMAADLFETYAVTAVAVMLLASTTFPAAQVELYPLAIGGMSILASIVGTLFARVGRSGNDHECALQGGARRDGAVRDRVHPGNARVRLQPVQLLGSVPPALVGLIVTFLLVAITEYYTGTRWNPVKSIAKSSRTGHATNIIEGLAVGMQATALPVDRPRRRDPGGEHVRRACTGSASP